MKRSIWRFFFLTRTGRPLFSGSPSMAIEQIGVLNCFSSQKSLQPQLKKFPQVQGL